MRHHTQTHTQAQSTRTHEHAPRSFWQKGRQSRVSATLGADPFVSSDLVEAARAAERRERAALAASANTLVGLAAEAERAQARWKARVPSVPGADASADAAAAVVALVTRIQAQQAVVGQHNAALDAAEQASAPMPPLPRSAEPSTRPGKKRTSKRAKRSELVYDAESLPPIQRSPTHRRAVHLGSSPTTTTSPARALQRAGQHAPTRARTSSIEPGTRNGQRSPGRAPVGGRPRVPAPPRP